MSSLTWKVLVDWDNDGVLESDEAGRVFAFASNRGRTSYFQGNSLAPMGVGKFVMTLHNFDNRYTWSNSSSPLYGTLTPGKEVRVSVDDGVTEYPVFCGLIKDIRTYDYRDPKARIEVVDGWQWLKDNNSLTPVLINETTDVILSYILQSAHWPTSKWYLGQTGASELGVNTNLGTAGFISRVWGYTLGATGTTVPYWWADGASAYEEIGDVMEFDQGFAYINASGAFVYESRESMYSKAPSGTITQSKVLKDIELGRVDENLRNKVHVDYQQYSISTLGVIWTAPEVYYIGPESSYTVYAAWTSGPNVAETPLVAVTDYLVNSRDDGAGTDYTSSVTVSADWDATQASITFTNPELVGMYITFLQVRGQILTIDTAGSHDVQDDTSINLYGQKTISLNNDWIQSLSAAVERASWLLGWAKTPIPLPHLALEARDTEQFSFELGDTITVTLSAVGLDAVYRLAHISHRSMISMHDIRTEYIFEPFVFQDGWRLGTAGRSELGSTTQLVF